MVTWNSNDRKKSGFRVHIFTFSLSLLSSTRIFPICVFPPTKNRQQEVDRRGTRQSLRRACTALGGERESSCSRFYVRRGIFHWWSSVLRSSSISLQQRKLSLSPSHGFIRSSCASYSIIWDLINGTCAVSGAPCRVFHKCTLSHGGTHSQRFTYARVADSGVCLTHAKRLNIPDPRCTNMNTRSVRGDINS